MPVTSNGEILKEIGQLLEASRRVERDITELKLDIKNDTQRAEQSRGKIHAQLNALEVEQAKIRVDLSDTQDNVAAMKMVTDKVTRWQLIGIGALTVTGALGAGAGSLVAVYWQKIVAALTG